MQDFKEFWSKYGHTIKGVKSARKIVEFLFQKQKDQQLKIMQLEIHNQLLMSQLRDRDREIFESNVIH